MLLKVFRAERGTIVENFTAFSLKFSKDQEIVEFKKLEKFEFHSRSEFSLEKPFSVIVTALDLFNFVRAT